MRACVHLGSRTVILNEILRKKTVPEKKNRKKTEKKKQRREKKQKKTEKKTVLKE